MKKGLGKGLNALFDDNTMEVQERETTQTLRLSDIEPNRSQPRREFDEEKLAALAASIEAHGVLQPIIVMPGGAGKYTIIAGERRWRAARLAGLAEIPVIVRDLSKQDIMEISLIENMQREDLNPIEEAAGLRTLIDEFGFTQEALSERVGRSRPAIANALRLLALPPEVQEFVKDNTLSAGHARTLMGLPSPEDILEAADIVVERGLSVRETEKLVKQMQHRKARKDDKTNAQAAADELYFTELEHDLTDHLGRKVNIADGAKKGVIKIEYYGREDLDTLLGLLRK